MEIRLKKQPQKYLDSLDEALRNKLYKAFEKLSMLDANIVPLSDRDNLYRCKISQHRIIFERDRNTIIIVAILAKNKSKS